MRWALGLLERQPVQMFAVCFRSGQMCSSGLRRLALESCCARLVSAPPAAPRRWRSNRCWPCVSGRSSARAGPAPGHLDPAGESQPSTDTHACWPLTRGSRASVHAPHGGRRVRAPHRPDGACRRDGEQPHLPHPSRDGLHPGTGQSQHQVRAATQR